MIKKFILLIIVSFTFNICLADCPDDHLVIGCNQDGIAGTGDDNKLFVDCTFKYRHSGDIDWQRWYYPLEYNPIDDWWYVQDPGLEMTEETDMQPLGTPNIDYRVIIECVSITPGFTARNATQAALFDEAGDWFNFSSLSLPHLHLEYRAASPAGETQMQWITFIIYDELENYEPSEPFSVVFVTDPLAGDLAIDGKVDVNDLAELCYYWLESSGSRENDYYERADVNRDGKVNFVDFALFASNWLTQ